MIKALKIVFLSVFSILVLSCNGVKNPVLCEQGDTIQFRYAEHITAVKYDSLTVVSLSDPWNEGQMLREYILVPRELEVESSELEDKYSTVNGQSSIIIRVPLSRTVVFNTAHASLLQMLGCLDAVKGVCDLQYMQLPEVQSRVGVDAENEAKAIVDCGDGMNPDIERIIELQPDALLLSPFENSGGHGALGKLDVPLIECADYMETSALGRAEWMRFYGMLFGCEEEADSLFNVVDSCYNSIKKNAQTAADERRKQGVQPPKMLTERLTSGTWYVPGGQSSMGRLIQDACAQYAWADDKHSGSLPLSFEAILDKASDATCWVFNYIGNEPLSYGNLLAEYKGYGQINAFKEHRVWYVNSLKVPYFETVPFRPDMLLRDYVTILYPELKWGEPQFFKPLKQ